MTGVRNSLAVCRVGTLNRLALVGAGAVIVDGRFFAPDLFDTLAAFG